MMRLGLGLNLTQRLQLRCRTCGRSHDEEGRNDCPVKLIDQVLTREPTWSCPACHGQVQTNVDDFLQCRKCATRFSTSIVGDPSGEPVYIKNVIPNDTYQRVQPLKGLGKRRGKVFKVDVLVKQLQERAREWRRQRREEFRGE